MAEDNKKPKEASNIFHSIMKASVKPKKIDFNKAIADVKDKFKIELTYKSGKGLVFPKDIHEEQVIEIQKYIRENL